jgi:hypothetical protein
MLKGWGCDYLQGELIGAASIAPPWRPPVSAIGKTADTVTADQADRNSIGIAGLSDGRISSGSGRPARAP